MELRLACGSECSFYILDGNVCRKAECLGSGRREISDICTPLSETPHFDATLVPFSQLSDDYESKFTQLELFTTVPIP